MDLATFNVTKYNITSKYKSEQKFFSQWVIKTVATLEIPCIKKHQTHSKSSLELSIQELKCMTDEIAVFVQQTENLPEGFHDALNMVFALLAGRRECAALFHALPLEDGQNRPKVDAGHQKVIEDFQSIYDTLQTAAAFALSNQTLSLPVANHSNQQDDNGSDSLDDSRSHTADDTPVPSEQCDAQIMQVANSAGTTTLSDYGSDIMRKLETLASIRRLVRATWFDYRARRQRPSDH